MLTLAFLGLLLISVPSLLVNQFLSIDDPTWAKVYGGVVGLGLLLLTVFFVWAMLRVWRATGRKQRRRELSDKRRVNSRSRSASGKSMPTSRRWKTCGPTLP